MFARAARKWKTLRRFAGARRGSAALEFSLVAVPFFLLTFGLAEISLIGFAQTSLDFGVSEAARQIRTGRAQMTGMSQQDIRDRICTEVSAFLVVNCGENLYLDVRQFASFVDASNAANTPIQDGQFSDAGFGYNPGTPSSIVVVRAFYRWKIMTPMFEPVFQNISGGERVIVSTMMFRNEPYQ